MADARGRSPTGVAGPLLLLRAAVRRRAALRPRRGVPVLGALARGWVARRRARAADRARVAGARARGGGAVARSRSVRRARCRCRPARRGSAPARAGAAGRPARGARVRIDVRFARRGRRAHAAGARRCATRSASPTRVVAGRTRRGARAPARSSRPRAPARAARARPLHARAAPVAPPRRSSSTACALREGAPARASTGRRFARAGELLERRLRAEADTRPLVVLDPRGAAVDGGARRRRARRRVAGPCTSRARAAARCCCPATGGRPPLEPAGGLAAAARAAGADRPGVRGPRSPGMAGRRGPVIYVAARRGPRPPRALRDAPGGGRLLVVPGAIAGRVPSSRWRAVTATSSTSGAAGGGGMMGANACASARRRCRAAEAPAVVRSRAGPRAASPAPCRWPAFGASMGRAARRPTAAAGWLLGALARRERRGGRVARARVARSGRAVGVAGAGRRGRRGRSPRALMPGCRARCCARPLGRAASGIPRRDSTRAALARAYRGASTPGCASTLSLAGAARRVRRADRVLAAAAAPRRRSPLGAAVVARPRLRGPVVEHGPRTPTARRGLRVLLGALPVGRPRPRPRDAAAGVRRRTVRWAPLSSRRGSTGSKPWIDDECSPGARSPTRRRRFGWDHPTGR